MVWNRCIDQWFSPAPCNFGPTKISGATTQCQPGLEISGTRRQHSILKPNRAMALVHRIPKEEGISGQSEGARVVRNEAREMAGLDRAGLGSRCKDFHSE